MNVDISIDMYEYVMSDTHIYAICRLKKRSYSEHFRHDNVRIEIITGYKRSSNEVITRAYEIRHLSVKIDVEYFGIPIATFTSANLNERSKRYLDDKDMKELEKGRELLVYAKLIWVAEIVRILKILDKVEFHEVAEIDIMDLLKSVKVFSAVNEISPIVLVLRENPRFFGILAPAIVIV